MSDYFKPVGTAATGFVEARLGPFRCSHCLHYNDGLCNHYEVVRDPDVPKDRSGEKARVHPFDCCNLYRPKIKDLKSDVIRGREHY